MSGNQLEDRKFGIISKCTEEYKRDRDLKVICEYKVYFYNSKK